MRVFVCLLFLFASNLALSKDIILLTSLPEKDSVYQKNIEFAFINHTRDFARLGFKIKIMHQVDQELLSQTLTDPNSHAVFWLSHGGAMTGQSGRGVQASAKLLDYQGDNVAKVFQRIHPNIKFVSILGCNSKLIMQALLPKREDTHYYIPQGKISAKRALKVSTRTFRYFYHRKSNQTIDAPIYSWGYQVQVRRKTASEFPVYKSLQVFAGDKFLGVLPKMSPNSEESFSLYIPYQAHYSAKDLKIMFTTGQSAFDTKNHFGELEIAYQEIFPWRLFAKPNGEPFGVNVRIFHFKSKINILSSPSPFINFHMEKTNE